MYTTISQFCVRAALVFTLSSSFLLMQGLNAAPKLLGEPDFNNATLIGTVFFDVNLNGYLDEGEEGIPGVRIVSVTGLILETDGYGRFHMPDINTRSWTVESKQLLKVDIQSLPQGARMTTENPRLFRSSSILNKINFGVVF